MMRLCDPEEFSASVYDKLAPNRVGLTPNPGRLIGAAAGIRTRVPGCLLIRMGSRCHRPGCPPALLEVESLGWLALEDRKSTRLNSSHVSISYAVFCLKKKRRT